MTDSTGILSGMLDSPRKQRRFFIASGVIFAIGTVAFVATFLLRGTSNAFTDTFSNQPASLSKPEKTVAVTNEQISLMRTFIKTAVARKNLAYAYTIVDPDLRDGLTKKQWMTGNIPVVQYLAENVDTAKFVPVYHHQTAALFDVDLIPVGRTQTRPQLRFFIGLKREGGTKTGRWLVNYWQPDWRPPVPMAPG
jgi:hypothetical protein